MKIILLFGGRSAEHEVSVLSAANVLPRLSALGHEVTPIGVARDGTLLRYVGAPDALEDAWKGASVSASILFEGGKLSFLSGASHISPDLVFSVLHGKDGEDGAWQGLLTLAHIPFVGAGVCASAIGFNKRLSKILAAGCGAPIVPYLSVRAWSDELYARVEHRLSYPLFVKPTSGGSSVGVSRVENEDELKRAVMLALSEDEEALIEEAVDGSELEVAVLERDGQLLLSPPGEIRTHGAFYDYNAKYHEKTTEFLLPAPLTLWESAFVKQLAASVFRALGCRDLARVDFLRRRDGKIFFNEINTLPGFTEDSLFPRLLSLLGVDALTFLVEGRT